MDEPRDDLVVPGEVVVPGRPQLVEGRLLRRAHGRGVDRVDPVVDALLRLEQSRPVVGVGGERDLRAVGGDVGEDQALPSGDVGDLEARGLGVGEHAVDGAELLGQVALLTDGGQSGAGTDEDERADGAEGETQPTADAQIGEAVQVHEGLLCKVDGCAALRPSRPQESQALQHESRRRSSALSIRAAPCRIAPQHLAGSPPRHCRLAARMPFTEMRGPGGNRRRAIPVAPGRRGERSAQ